jgi:hypothetical protein
VLHWLQRVDRPEREGWPKRVQAKAGSWGWKGPLMLRGIDKTLLMFRSGWTGWECKGSCVCQLSTAEQRFSPVRREVGMCRAVLAADAKRGQKGGALG